MVLYIKAWKSPLHLNKCKGEQIENQKKRAEKLKADIESANEELSEKQQAMEEEKKAKENLISIEDFAKVELTVGKVVACEKVEKSEKLLKLQVDLGKETRTIVSGIAMSYNEENIIESKKFDEDGLLLGWPIGFFAKEEE